MAETNIGNITGACSEGSPEAGTIGHIPQLRVGGVGIFICELVDLIFRDLEGAFG